MNPYFTPRKPEPRPRAAWVVIGSMICTLGILALGAGLWAGRDLLHDTAASTNRVEHSQNVAPTNSEIVGFP
jgi:hypothetical protein